MSEQSITEATTTLRSGMITQSTKVEQFETMLHAHFNYPYILTINSATSGLTIAYKLLDLNPGDKVISTPLTCVATNIPIVHNNLDIVWADIDPHTCNIDLDDVKLKLKADTRALSIVHWGGNPIDYNKLQSIKDYYYNLYNKELYVIEDCAHAFGAKYMDTFVGIKGNIAVFSLQAIKHLTTGDGGLLVLPNKELYDRAKLLRWYGIDRARKQTVGNDDRLEPDIIEYGFKYHMNDINASIGIGNLSHISTLIDRCRNNGQFYNTELANTEGVILFNLYEGSSYWIYTIRVLNNTKKRFMNYMKTKGITVSQVHARNDTHSFLSKYKCNLPVLDMLESEIISIPVGWWVSNEDRVHVVTCIKSFFDTHVLRKMIRTDIEQYYKLIYQLNNHTGEIRPVSDELINSVYVLEIHGEIVSTVKLIIEDKLYEPLAHIEDVVTDSNHRGKGYGKMLTKYVSDLALNNFKCYKVILNCYPTNVPFYEKCGFISSGQVSLVIRHS